MIKEAIGTGATLDEAREAAVAELAAGEQDNVQFEVISMPEKKKLGLFGGKLAQVRAFVELPDPKPAKDGHRKENPKKAKPHAEPKEERRSAPAPKDAPDFPEEPVGVPAEQLNPNSRAARAVNYLKGVLKELGCGELSFTVDADEDGARIMLSGDESGMIIGRRGETLDALQYLASLASSKKGNGYYRVVLNIGNYRQKREGTLAGVARKTAAQVLRTGRRRTLEPMNPYERRIIHTTVQTIDGVTSESIGEGGSRRVVISPEGGERPRAPRGDRRGYTPAPTSDKTEKTVDHADAPLYGRIH